jgi:putative Mg2+ transporter-C (MgtC) family protein
MSRQDTALLRYDRRDYAVAVRTTLQLTLFGRAALGAVFGLAIGLEREYRGKAAGERTFALLAFAAAGFAAVGALLLGVQGTSRVIQGVATGVGFLGAGLIFQRKPTDVRGLTTAAASWAATAVGILAGLGAYLAAALATGFLILILELDRIPMFRRIHEQTEGPPSHRPTGGP